MCLNSIEMPENQTTVDARTSSTNCDTPRDVSSAGDEHTLKVRKPYTITKQRERWTDEEHNKFLEAIKLYGRAWRRIEDHIGTKTTVQIRSHAQKFFSKVVRGSTDNGEGAIKPTEIPPPRPKRKPKHPYPRKLGRKPIGQLPILQKMERSLSLVRSEQENRSPKSVLSVFSSDVIGSSASDTLNHCISSDSSTSGSNHTGLEFIEQEHGSNSHVSSAGEEKGTSMAAEAMSDMKLDHVPTITSFQLFGKKIVISSAAESMPECPMVSKFTDNKPQQNNEQVVELADTVQQVLATQEDICGASCKDSWGAWSCGVQQMLYRFPSQQELIDAARATAKNQPMLVFYNGVQFPATQKYHSQFGKETFDDKQMHEDSWTGSNTEKSCDAVESNLLQSGPSSNNSKSEPREQVRGFVPYKRRLAERETRQKSKNSEEAESQRIKFCL